MVVLSFNITVDQAIALRREAERRKVAFTALAKAILLNATDGLTTFPQVEVTSRRRVVTLEDLENGDGLGVINDIPFDELPHNPSPELYDDTPIDSEDTPSPDIATLPSPYQYIPDTNDFWFPEHKYRELLEQPGVSRIEKEEIRRRLRDPWKPRG